MLPDVMLDDVRFQELVSEARTRIVRHSPDWTEHNVSDPGITLIELFAWLTDVLTYRINRIPRRVHLALLDLLGVQPAPPEQASTDLRFILDGPFGAVIPAGTEVASPRAAGGDLVTFQTDEGLAIPTAALVACAVQRGGALEPIQVRGDTAAPTGEQRTLFGSTPRPNDAILFGFDHPLSRLVVRVSFDCTRAVAAGVDPADPPLAWEVSGADGEWFPAVVISDDTGGFLLGGGGVMLELPEQTAAAQLGDRRLDWLRCRITARDDGRGYSPSPVLTAVTAAVFGGTVRAHHAATARGELVGTSDGIPGTAYGLQHRPLLELEEGETLEVRERPGEDWVEWHHVPDFGASGPGDRHFHLDRVAGEIRFGPAIRQPDGGWRHRGAVPPAGAVLRYTRYRYGGGRDGNVAPRTLTMLSSPITGVAAVGNPRPATGGADGEPLASARERARLEVRSRSRAVTADDFRRLTLEASPEVARAICTAPPDGGAVRVHVLPRVEPADRQLELAELTPGTGLMETVAAALDRRRLLGTSIRLLPVRLKGVSVVVDVRASPRADLERVQHDVGHALYIYLNPLIGGSPEGPGAGWPPGRALNQGELFGIAYSIPGVEFVNILRTYETDLRTGEQAAQPTDTQVLLAGDELIASGRHIVKASHRE